MFALKLLSSVLLLIIYLKLASAQAATGNNTITLVITEDITKIKAHGCLMVIAWILFASTGILFARYYRFLFPKLKICNLQFWFVMHRPIMLFVPTLSITAFLVILAHLNWTWVDPEDKVEFAHSIFGILAIFVAVIQPIIGLLRCGKDHKYRFIFNHIHRTVGLFGLLCSIVALYLGVLIKDINLGDNGWGIITGWTVWVICFPAFLEIIDMYMGDEPGSTYVIDPKKRAKTVKCGRILKQILLIAHLIVALAFTVALLVLIGIAQAPSEEI